MKLKAFMKVIWSEKKYKTVFIICSVLAVLIIVGAIASAIYTKQKSQNFPIAAPTTKQIEQPKVVSPLDGISYAADIANRHPLAVMVENHPDARPQSGLINASIVYEAITEGGITRFMAVYGPTDAPEIGPIRSARLFYMDWVKEYDAFYAHAGGNEDALAKIGTYGIKNLENNTGYFTRDSKGRNVASEHTLFSTTSKLYDYAKNQKFDTTTSNFETLKFKADGPADPAGKGATIDFSSASYKVDWAYDPTTNAYSRNLAGVAHKDRTSGEQIKSNNIVIQVVDRTFQPTGSYGSQNYVFKNIGSGKAYVLEDGKTISATWTKSSLTSRTKYTDAAGVEIQFNPGKTWYEIIPPEVSPVF
jgi:hypothetical protein